MIDKVVIENWKRFDTIEFDLQRRHVVLVGPNNCGKTSVLQAIAAWGFALHRWRLHNQALERQDYKGKRVWPFHPITLEQFTPVSVRDFTALWRDRDNAEPISVAVTAGPHRVGMKFKADANSPFQMLVRPTNDTTEDAIRNLTLPTLFVPSMTGMQVEEPVLRRPKIDQFLGRNRPGEVLRNLVATVAEDAAAWQRLVDTIRDLFGVEMLRPDASGADIVADYRHVGGSTQFDLASGGSGFQQIVMLLAFLERQERSVLLLDEPDAHLHVFLQERIVEVLRSAAARAGSLFLAATHSEVILDTVEHDEVYVLLDQPKRLVDKADKAVLADALRVIDHNDLAKAREAPGVLYLEDYTDLAILREWARVLGHPAEALLGPLVFWRKIVADAGRGRPGVSAAEHFAALRLARPGYRGLQLVDGDAKEQGPTDQVYGTAPPKVRWRRYEVESYLVHPAVLERFVEQRVGSGAASAAHRADLKRHFEQQYPPAFLRDPLADLPMLVATKARTELLGNAFVAAGLPNLDYRDFHEIAALMQPDEIHPEVRLKLDQIHATLAGAAP